VGARMEDSVAVVPPVVVLVSGEFNLALPGLGNAFGDTRHTLPARTRSYGQRFQLPLWPSPPR
jgi:hypothetical protein